MYISSKAMFITFEGIDGCGKSSQTKRLLERLNDEGIKTILVREPGGTPISEEVRDILLDKRSKGMSNRTEALLMTASRAQLTHELVQPNLEKGNWVIADRYADSTLAYQGGGRKIDLDWLIQLNHFATFGIQPNLTFVVDVMPEEAFRRKTGENDRIESEGILFQNEVRKKYADLIKLFPDRIVLVDGHKSEEEIHNTIWEELLRRKYFNEKK